MSNIHQELLRSKTQQLQALENNRMHEEHARTPIPRCGDIYASTSVGVFFDLPYIGKDDDK